MSALRSSLRWIILILTVVIFVLTTVTFVSWYLRKSAITHTITHLLTYNNNNQQQSFRIMLDLDYHRQLQTIINEINISNGHLKEQPEEEGAQVIQGTTIPKNIFQTIPKSFLHLHRETQGWITTWTEKNKNYHYHLYNDTAMDDFVKSRAPDYYETFKSFSSPVQKADFWRYIVIYVLGGIYTDADTECAEPIDNWLEHYKLNTNNDISMIIGLEGKMTESEARLVGFCGSLQFNQWTFAGTRGHPFLKLVLDTIKELRRKGIKTRLSEVLHTTGPCVWTVVLCEYLRKLQNDPQPCHSDLFNRNMVSPVIIGDIAILPFFAFSSGSAFWESYTSTKALSNHKFKGSWKNKANF